MRAELQEWLRFLRAESNVLRQSSSRLFQQAMNQPDASAPARSARSRFEAGRETRPWFHWLNKPKRAEPEILTLVEAILDIARQANLTLADVPCRSLPDEAWSDPRLLSDCIACRKPLKFNPFINDLRRRVPQPAASGPARIIRKLWGNSRGG